MTETLDYPSLKELRAALNGRVSPALLFLSGFTETELGETATVVLHAEREGLKVPVSGLVTWRYPNGSVPPGRIAGVGLLLDDESREQPLYRSIIDGLDVLIPPGGRLPIWLQMAAADGSPDTVDNFDGSTGSFDRLEESWDEIPTQLTEKSPFDDATSDISMESFGDADFEDQTLSTTALLDAEREVTVDGNEPVDSPSDFEAGDTRADVPMELKTSDFFPVDDEPPAPDPAHEAEPSIEIRALPTLPGFPELPLPILSGRACVFVPARRGPIQVANVSWPEEGTKRVTWFEQERERGRSVQELLEVGRGTADEMTDPARVTDVVARATAATDTADADGKAETVLALPIAIWVGRGDDDEGAPSCLFESGISLPAEATMKLRGKKGALHVEARVLSERWGEPGHDLIAVTRFPLAEKGPRAIRARFTLSIRGILTVEAPADDPKHEGPLHTDRIDTGIVPVPLRPDSFNRDRGLLTTLKRLFRSD